MWSKRKFSLTTGRGRAGINELFGSQSQTQADLSPQSQNDWSVPSQSQSRWRAPRFQQRTQIAASQPADDLPLKSIPRANNNATNYSSSLSQPVESRVCSSLGNNNNNYSSGYRHHPHRSESREDRIYASQPEFRHTPIGITQSEQSFSQLPSKQSFSVNNKTSQERVGSSFSLNCKVAAEPGNKLERNNYSDSQTEYRQPTFNLRKQVSGFQNKTVGDKQLYYKKDKKIPPADDNNIKRPRVPESVELSKKEDIERWKSLENVCSSLTTLVTRIENRLSEASSRLEEVRETATGVHQTHKLQTNLLNVKLVNCITEYREAEKSINDVTKAVLAEQKQATAGKIPADVPNSKVTTDVVEDKNSAHNSQIELRVNELHQIGLTPNKLEESSSSTDSTTSLSETLSLQQTPFMTPPADDSLTETSTTVIEVKEEEEHFYTQLCLSPDMSKLERIDNSVNALEVEEEATDYLSLLSLSPVCLSPCSPQEEITQSDSDASDLLQFMFDAY